MKVMSNNNKAQWQGVSLKKNFFELIQKHVTGNPRYHSVADFIRQAVLDKIDRENNLNNNYQPKRENK